MAPPSSLPTSGSAWTEPLLVNPHAVADKAQRVGRMFSAIAPTYDLINRLHSLGMDQHWRTVAVRMAEVKAGDTVLDVACGTGDLTLKFARALGQRGSGAVVGVDFTYVMLPLAQGKAKRLNLRRSVGAAFLQGNALALPVPDCSVDVVSIAFGIRNVADWGKAIDEFTRVLKPGGRLIILEFSLPAKAILRGLYNFYFHRIMPVTATLISGDKTGAYKYLPKSVNTFISREAMTERMMQAGFEGVVGKALTCGICVCYRGVKGGGSHAKS